MGYQVFTGAVIHQGKYVMVDTANVLGVELALIKLEDVLATIQKAIEGNRRLFISHTNVSGLKIAYEQPWYRDILNSSDIVFCDGMGVILGGRMLGYHIPQRFTLADWMYPLAELAEANKYSLFFLGNPPGAAEKAVLYLKEKFPGLLVSGTQHGYFNKSPGDAENSNVVEYINRVRPDILLVGLGMPKQEKWLFENWKSLNVKISITCGALFEYLSGDLKRGPRWMTEHYLEWLARMIISPRRYYKRYLRDNPLFLYRILKQKYLGVCDK